MSDSFRPEVYVSPDRLKALEALAFAGLMPNAAHELTYQEPAEASLAEREFADEYSVDTRLTDAMNEDVPNSSNWRSFSICRGRTHLFFPSIVERPQQKARRESSAKALCALCPVERLCLDAANRRNEYGIWGGTNEEERQLGRRLIY